MTTYNGNIKNLLQGISQQPRRDRRPEQLTTQENCFSSITKGLGRRPGTNKAATVIPIPGFVDGSKHTYTRGDGEEKYTITLTDSGMYVVDLSTGISQAISLNTNLELDGTVPTYLQNHIPGDTRTPSEYLSFFTIADTTFVVNKTVTPEMGGPTDDPGWQCCLYLAKAAYGRDYRVYADGVTIAETTTKSVEIISTDEVSKTTGLKSTDIMGLLAEGTDSPTNVPPIAYNAHNHPYGELDPYMFYVKTEGSTLDNGSVVTISNGLGSPTTRWTCYGKAVNTYTGETGFLTWYEGEGYPSTAEWPWFTQKLDFVVTLVPSAPTTIEGSIREWAVANNVDMRTSLDTSVVVLQKATPHVLEVSDDSNNDDLRIIGTSYSQYDKLPPVCLGGYKVKITGEDADSANDYYVEFIRDDKGTGVGRGTWKETVGFQENVVISPATMPHKITRLTPGGVTTFELSQNEWDTMKTGDSISNPPPSFIGTPIQAMGLYMDRFVFLTGENVVASQTYDHFNLFSDSVIVESDTDPIDTASSDNQVTNLEHMVVFDASLMIFSNRAQFIHTSDKAFTSKLFALSSKSRYSTDVRTTPVYSATSVFFAHRFGEFTGIREYRVDPITGISSAEPITHHAQKYIKGRCLQMVSTTDYSILLARSEDNPKDLYVYEWFDQDNQRKQAAWHKWKFLYDIVHMDIIQDTLYLWYTAGGDNVAYMTLDLSDRDTEHLDFSLRLDNIAATQAIDYDDEWWQINRSLEDLNTDSWDNVVLIGGENSGVEGAEVAWSSQDSETMWVKKVDLPNSTGSPYFYSGVKYLSYIEITNPYVRDSLGNPKTHAKTALKTMKFNCTETGDLWLEVKKDLAINFKKTFSSQVIGSPNYLLNSHAPLEDVQITLPIRTDANMCQVQAGSDSHLPFYIGDIDWSCSYNEKGRRTI